MTDTTIGAAESDARVTGLSAMQLEESAGQSLVRVETDAGVVGYGEAGADGPTVRAQLEHLEEFVVGADPLAVQRLYEQMMSMQHAYRPHVPTVSGVDIALWDLAGKLLDRPVSTLTTGRFRDRVPLYGVNMSPDDLLDPQSCREWAEEVSGRPEGFRAVKFSFDAVIEGVSPDRKPIAAGRDNRTLTSAELRAVERAAENAREALGDEFDYIAHCHNEWDLPSAVRLAEAVAAGDPLWIEDALPVGYSEEWVQFRESSPVTVLTGEKLEGRREFKPFIENGAVDAVQPDLAFAGGITGCRRIAELAGLHYVPVNAHNVGTVVQNAATIHFGASVRNFWMTESRYPNSDLYQSMGTDLHIEDGAFLVPDGPGLGVTLDEDVLREHRADGEPYWD
ncbi:MAG: mandelate racemase/muconate lactonizing enzyme family protein [Halobacteriaceae archaeon]